MTKESVSAVVAVRWFALALREIRTRLVADLPGITGVRDLMLAARPGGTLARQGRSASGIEYSVQGRGCRLTDADNRMVNVDLVADPDRPGSHVEAFDAWRIRLFFRDEEYRALSDAELNDACIRLAGRGELRVVEPGRWYALGTPALARSAG